MNLVVDAAPVRRVADHIANAIAVRLALDPGPFHLALSGGRSPAEMLAILARVPLPWERVHVWQVDERDAPPGHADRNWTTLQGRLAVPAVFHPMPVEAADADVRYAAALGGRALDLVHLGVGADGHTASLLPGAADLPGDVAWTAVYQGRRRLTLTFGALDRARERVWLVTGADKRDALQRLVAGDPTIPAGRVRRDAATVYADPAAGGG